MAEGRIEDNAAETNGSYGWCRIAHLQSFYRDVLLRHFPHHVAITQANVGNVLWEAFGNYLGFDVDITPVKSRPVPNSTAILEDDEPKFSCVGTSSWRNRERKPSRNGFWAAASRSA